MKQCNRCGMQTDDQSVFCAYCGASDFMQPATENNQPIQPFIEQAQTYPPIYNAVYPAQAEENGNSKDNGNILAGIVGAFLLSCVGGLLYFVLYQIGFISGICGLVIFILANFGYDLFAKTRNKVSYVALIVSVIVTIIMIFAAEYLSLSFVIWQEWKSYGINFFDAIAVTPDFLSDPEIRDAVLSDLAFAYVFGLVAVIGNIVSMVKGRRKRK